MPDIQPTIRVTGFRQTFEKAFEEVGRDDQNRPIRKPILNEVGEQTLEAIDWVDWVPLSSPQAVSNTEKVRRLDPKNLHLAENASSDSGEKAKHLRYIWDQIEPPYRAWKEGREIPLNGTPLATWPGITPEQGEIFRLAGIRTVEDVVNMSETTRQRVRLPNVRELQQLAAKYLENSGAAAAAEREMAKERRIAALEEQLGAAMELLETQNRTAQDVDEIDALRAKLEEQGTPYDKRWGVSRLSAALNGSQAA